MNEQKYTFTEIDTISVSDDLDSRHEKTGKSVTVTYIFKEWTAKDLVNRLLISNSPRVAVQAILRKMKEIPNEFTYVVPKAGTRSVVATPENLIAAFGGNIDAAIEAMQKLRK